MQPKGYSYVFTWILINFFGKAHLAVFSRTRFGPNRPAADMEGNGEYDFWVIYEEIIGGIIEYFWRK